MLDSPARITGSLRTLTVGNPYESLSDSELLRRYAATGEEAAFTALLHRHGPLVLGACRRLLRDPHDAEDAFQATFLVLLRKAGSLRCIGSAAAWLSVVAHRIALRAQREAARRQTALARAPGRQAADPIDEVSGRELCAVLDEELTRLPEKNRLPLVLCCLEGLARDEAARRLDWSFATLKRRLEQGRRQLRRRLARRGFTLPATLGAVALAGSAARAVPAALLRSAVGLTRMSAAGQVPAAVESLTLGALPSLASVWLKLGAALVLLAALVSCGLSVCGPGAEKNDPAAPPAPMVKGSTRRADRHGDPLPPGALARMGTVRFRQAGSIFSAAFSPDGRTLASGAADRTLRIWDVATGRERRRVRANLNGAAEIAFSPDGRTVAAGCADHSVRLWEVAAGKERLRFVGHQGRITALLFDPSGRRLFSASGDTTALVWNLAHRR